MKYDVGVIGGGLMGLVCAWRLAQKGVRVGLFERGSVGQEASCAAAGMLAPLCEAARYPPAHGDRAPRQAMLQLCRDSLALYPAFAAELLSTTGIDIELCLSAIPDADWRAPGFHYFATDTNDQAIAGFRELQQEGYAVQEHATATLEPRLRHLVSAETVAPSFFDLPEEGQVNNRLMVQALAKAAVEAGVDIHENTAVQSLAIDSEKATGFNTDIGTVDCNHVLLCAGSWSGAVPGLPPDCLPPVRPIAGQVLSLRSHGEIPGVVYSTSVYLVPRRDGRLLVGATMEESGYEKQPTEAGRQRLHDAATKLIPRVQDFAVEDHWAGLRPASVDGLPVLGATRVKNLYAATGHFRNGILLTPITGELMARCIVEGAAPPAAFNPERSYDG